MGGGGGENETCGHNLSFPPLPPPNFLKCQPTRNYNKFKWREWESLTTGLEFFLSFLLNSLSALMRKSFIFWTPPPSSLEQTFWKDLFFWIWWSRFGEIFLLQILSGKGPLHTFRKFSIFVGHSFFGPPFLEDSSSRKNGIVHGEGVVRTTQTLSEEEGRKR